MKRNLELKTNIVLGRLPFAIKELKLNVDLECNCTDDSINVMALELESDLIGLFEDCFIVSKDTNLDLLLPLEDAGFLKIIVIENLNTVVDSLLSSIQNFIDNKLLDTGVVRTGLGVYLK